MAKALDKGPRNRGERRWAALAGLAALCTLLLGLSTNVAASLVPEEWTKHNATWVWVATAVLGLVGVCLAIVARRASATSDHAANEDPAVDRSLRVRETSGTVVIAESGSTVSFQSLNAEPAPAQRAGQIVVGELPGAPPALIAREEVNRLVDLFRRGERIATVSALTGGRGAGKTQVAAQYAREAVANGVELVAWVSAEDPPRLLGGLAEVAERLGVADPEGDSETSAARLREALAARASRAILVLDNANDPGLVRRYLPSTGTAQIVITSTDRAFTSLGAEVRIGVFNRTQSVAYLAERTRLEDVAGADALAEELGDLPLALAQAASVIELQGLSYPTYLERLRSLPLEDMLLPNRGDEYPYATDRAILLSVEAAQEGDPEGATMDILRSVALLASDGVSRRVLGEVAAVPERPRLDKTLARLVQTSLLVWAKDREIVVMHRMVARAVRDQLEKSGGLAAGVDTARRRLLPLMPDEKQAWNRRHADAEILGHAISLWEVGVTGFERGALTHAELEAHASLGHVVVRHLVATADISRATQIAKSVQESCDRLLGPENDETLAARNNLAATYKAAGDFAQAVAVQQETVAVHERLLGHDDPRTLIVRSNLAGFYFHAGKHDDAIKMHEEILAIREDALGPEDPGTLFSRNNLASAHHSAGNAEKARELLEETLAVSMRVLGTDDPQTLTTKSNLAATYRLLGKVATALSLNQETLEARQRVLGADHPDTLTSRNNLAKSYEAAGDRNAAARLYTEALVECERGLGPDHPYTKTVRDNLQALHSSEPS
ncbi:MAG TPA: tetratricopeptide repeat protein [Thermoleophilaceae bacterium]